MGRGRARAPAARARGRRRAFLPRRMPFATSPARARWRPRLGMRRGKHGARRHKRGGRFARRRRRRRPTPAAAHPAPARTSSYSPYPSFLPRRCLHAACTRHMFCAVPPADTTAPAAVDAAALAASALYSAGHTTTWTGKTSPLLYACLQEPCCCLFFAGRAPCLYCISLLALPPMPFVRAYAARTRATPAHHRSHAHAFAPPRSPPLACARAPLMVRATFATTGCKRRARCALMPPPAHAAVVLMRAAAHSFSWTFCSFVPHSFSSWFFSYLPLFTHYL